MTVVRGGAQSERTEEIARAFAPNDNSFRREMEVFAEGLKRNQVERRALPEEGLEDLKIMAAILKSGKEDGAMQKLG